VANQPLPHAAFLATREVREAIGMVLRARGVNALDVEDLTHDVIERALRMAQPPQSQEDCVRVVRKIAKDMAIDAFKLRRGRAKYDVGPYENPDEAPAGGSATGEGLHPIDVARQLAVVQRQVEIGNITERQAAMLERAAMDTPHAEIASQMNLAPQTVRNELVAARRTARASWAAYLATALFASVALMLWISRRPPDVAKAPSPQQLAAMQRRDALNECAEQHWKACLDGLDEAARLDPVGDSAPDVVKARDDARQHLAPKP
jgi:DNA-directed RNA polymerase specialized sigma24 family protein